MSRTDFYDNLQEQLDRRKLQNRFRSLRSITESSSASSIIIDGSDYLNFSSNDYLGLSHHPLVRKRSVEYTQKYGTSASSSRLITGTLHIHSALEEKLAMLYGTERCLLYSTGFQANSTVLPALTSSEDLILADRKSHNSILTGALASKAAFTRYRHNDLDHLEALLKKEVSRRKGQIWIVTESIFSMDGDKAPLFEISGLAKQYGARLYVDDAHAIGLYGKTGMGCTEFMQDIDIIIGTFGKAVGSFGAFVASNRVIADTLINFSNGFIYTTALPPAVIGAVDAACDLIPGMETERNRIRKRMHQAHQMIMDCGFKTGKFPSHILPVTIGDDQKTVDLSNTLFEQGILVVAIRPPTVPEGESKIRLSITAHHSSVHLNTLKRSLLHA